MAAVFLSALALFPGAADAQDTYGTGSLTAHVVGSFAFQPRAASLPMSTASGVERFFTNALSFADATPMLPNGAQIESVELRACDTTAGGEVRAQLLSCNVPGGGCALIANIQTGIGTTGGCTLYPVAVTPPLIVNNATQVLDVQVTTGTTAETTFSAVKLLYRLRVSPAPAVASFGDVPTTHGQFRFVEALAAAGITGGCGGGNFCPDAPLTRGQMAVFLSTALGLHFPN